MATLTYRDEKLSGPDVGLPPTVSKRHVDLWLARLRKRWGSQRYFVAAEYGERTRRPHYHALLFHRLFTKADIELDWTAGHVDVQPMNAATIMYTAQYVQKKMFGKLADRYYRGRLAPFVRQSNSLGYHYAEKYHGDLKAHGAVWIPDPRGGGHLAPLPRRMLQKLAKTDPETHAQLLSDRKAAALSKQLPHHKEKHRLEAIEHNLNVRQTLKLRDCE